MEDTGTTDATAVANGTQPAQPTPESASQTFIGDDGVLQDGWKEKYLDEADRGEKVFDRIKNLRAMGKSLASAERMIGKDKIAMPSDSYGENEWDQWYRAGGRPDTSVEYELSRPEDLPEEFYSQDLAVAAQELFHKIGLNKKQAEALFEFNNTNVIKQLKSQSVDAELAAEELENGLRNDWGNGYEQKKHLGNIAVEHGTDGDTAFKERLLDKFGNDPDFIRYSSNLGGKFQEASGVKVPIQPELSRTDIQEQINELQVSDSFMNRRNPGHKAAMAKMEQLYKKKNAFSGQPV